MIEDFSPADPFKSLRVSVALPIVNRVIAGKSLAVLARESGRAVLKVEDDFGWFLHRFLLSHCDPYLRRDYPEAYATRSGVGMSKLVREHSELFRARIERLQEMMSNHKRLGAMALDELKTVDLDATVLFPARLQEWLLSQNIKSLGALEERSIPGLINAGLVQVDVDVLVRFLGYYRIVLRPEIRLRHDSAVLTGFSERALFELNEARIYFVDQLESIGDDVCLNAPKIRLRTIQEMRQILAAPSFLRLPV